MNNGWWLVAPSARPKTHPAAPAVCVCVCLCVCVCVCVCLCVCACVHARAPQRPTGLLHTSAHCTPVHVRTCPSPPPPPPPHTHTNTILMWVHVHSPSALLACCHLHMCVHVQLCMYACLCTVNVYVHSNNACTGTHPPVFLTELLTCCRPVSLGYVNHGLHTQVCMCVYVCAHMHA